MKKDNEDRAYVAKRLQSEDEYVFFAVKLLYEAQTPYEQEQRKTLVKNQRGFNKPDADRLTKLASKAIERGHLTADELAMLQKPNKSGLPVLAKYWEQIQAAEGEDQMVVQIPRKPPRPEGLSENDEESAEPFGGAA